VVCIDGHDANGVTRIAEILGLGVMDPPRLVGDDERMAGYSPPCFVGRLRSICVAIGYDQVFDIALSESVKPLLSMLEIKWLLQRLIEVMKVAGLLADLDGLADGFSA
jgi:hypothetical protein